MEFHSGTDWCDVCQLLAVSRCTSEIAPDETQLPRYLGCHKINVVRPFKVVIEVDT